MKKVYNIKVNEYSRIEDLKFPNRPDKEIEINSEMENFYWKVGKVKKLVMSDSKYYHKVPNKIYKVGGWFMGKFNSKFMEAEIIK